METKTELISKDVREAINDYIYDNGIKQTWVAEQLGISPSHFSLILKKERELSEKHRIKLNEIWGQDF
jgi:predicted XRE-type DNA-binding protein